MRNKLPLFAYLLGLAVPMSIDVCTVILPEIAMQLHVGKGAASRITFVMFIGMILGTLFYANIADVLGRKRTVVGAIMIVILGSMISAFSTNISFLYLGRIITGFGVVGIPVVFRIMATDIFDQPNKITKVFSNYIIGASLSSVVIPVIISHITNVLGWRFSFIVLMLSFLIVLCVVIKYLEDTGLKNEKPYTGEILLDFKSIVADKCLIKFAFLAGVVYTYNIFYFATSSFVYREFFGISLLENGYVFSLCAFCIIIGSFMLKFLLHYFNRYQIMNIILICYLFVNAILFVLFGIFHCHSIRVFIILICGNIFMFGMLSPLFISEGLIMTKVAKSTTSSFQVFMRVLVSLFIGGVFTYLPALNITWLTFILFIISIITVVVFFYSKLNIFKNII